MTGKIGTISFDYDACETCFLRHYRTDECTVTVAGNSIDMEADFEMEYVYCLNYKQGDPMSPEEIEAEHEADRKAEIDRKYQLKIFDHADG